MTTLDPDLDTPEDWGSSYAHETPVEIRRTPRVRNPEQNEILGAFTDILAGPTGDGGVKRASGIKPLWKRDPGHYDALLRHLDRYNQGERYDTDSGSPTMAHIAWRACALAYQLLDTDGHVPPAP